MDRAFSSGASGTPPSAPGSPSIGYATSGNPSTGTPATKPGPYWYHMVTEEIRGVLVAAGLTPSQADVTQLLQSLRAAGVFTTPAQFDNTTKAATTAFVQAALGNKSASASYSTATVNLSASDAGKMLYISGLTTTVNLPSLASVADGTTFNIQTAIALTIARAGSDFIAANGGGQASLAIAQNSTVIITKSNAINAWVVDGSSRLLYDGNFSASVAASGYQKLPSGLILQWGIQTCNTGATTTVTLPIAFPSGSAANYRVVATVESAAVTAANYAVAAKTSASQFTISINAGSGLGVTWFAIGF